MRAYLTPPPILWTVGTPLRMRRGGKAGACDGQGVRSFCGSARLPTLPPQANRAYNA